MFRASLCPSLGAQEYYTVVAACGISCCGFQVAGLVWSWGFCVRFVGCCSILQTGQTDIHVSGGIRTLILSWRAASDLRLRPRGRRDQHICIYLHEIFCLKGDKSTYSRNWNRPSPFLNALKFVITMYVVNKFSFTIARSVPEMLSLSDRKKWSETASESRNLIIHEYVLNCSHDARLYDSSEFAFQSLRWERQNKSGFTSCHWGQERKIQHAVQCRREDQTNINRQVWLQKPTVDSLSEFRRKCEYCF